MSFTSADHTIDVNDWEYMGEGGRHVIFSYHGKDVLFHGKILRVSKDTFRSCTGVSASGNYLSHFDAIQKSFPSEFDNSQGCTYFDEARLINIDRKQLENLALKVLESNAIPQSRKSDWTLKIDHSDTGCCLSPVYLMPNYRLIPKSISIEIKPKAGYITASPLVNCSNACKYRASRFQILQELNYRGIISKGWNKGSKLDRKSEYDPLDLFSGSFERIRKSIGALFCCPQNNLKVFYGGKMLFGDVYEEKYNNHCSSTSAMDDWFLFKEALGMFIDVCPSIQHGERQLRDILQDELVEVISKILYQDAIVPQLLTAQKQMDLLDADGAILVYERLVDLCEGSKEIAEQLIDADYNFGKAHTSLSSNLNEFYDYLHDSCGVNAFCADRYNRGKLLIQTLDKADCVDLLQKWLLSLVLCDLSIFIIISKCSDGWVSSIDSHRIQTSSGRLLQYTIKVIDYDRKQAKKLRERKQLDEKFAFFHSQQGPSSKK
jgi:inositol-pentakisphosphate 2-kinase